MTLESDISISDDALGIPGNVDPSTGNVTAPGDVRIGGNVVDQHSVSAGGNVVVEGVIESACVTAKGDVACLGGMAGKQQGRCVAGGKVSARYLRQAHVEAGGDVVVQTEITNSRVISGKDVVSEGGIVGGRVTAAGSVRCQSAGTSSDTRTLIELATDESLRRIAAELLPEVNRKRTKTANIRTRVAPLMQNPKRLTSLQKEQATELLFQADAAEEEANAILGELAKIYSRSIARAEPVFSVTGTLYAGVTLRFGSHEVALPRTIEGPAEIRLVSSAPGSKALQVLRTEDESTTLLAANPVVDPVMDQLRKEMAQRV